MTHLCAYPLYNLMQCLAVVTLHTFYLGKLDLWTVYLGKRMFSHATPKRYRPRGRDHFGG